MHKIHTHEENINNTAKIQQQQRQQQQ